MYLSKLECKMLQPLFERFIWKMDSVKIFSNAQSIEEVNRLSPEWTLVTVWMW